jgi:serine/threonine protein kinase
MDMDFVVGEEIGRGGMGSVFRAKQLDLDRDLAVKFIHASLVEDEDAVNRFLREANLTAKLDHPNIVRIYSRGKDESGRPYILMELLSGESLQQRLFRGKLPDAVAINITKQILSGLAAAHAKDIIHRDLKPANIFLTATGVVKILDFGIAKALGSSQMTGVGLKVGTPEYMSPEQASGITADKRSDLYSVGITLYEMVMGNVPFEADTPLGVLYKHVHDEVPPIPLDRPPQLRRLISSLLEKDPDARPQTAQAALLIMSTTPSGKSNSKAEPETKKSLMRRRKKGKPGSQETSIFSSTTQVVTGRPVRSLSKARKAFFTFIVVALISCAGVAAYLYVVPTYAMVFDKITDTLGVANLSLRVQVGQRFHVKRERTLELGGFNFKTLDEGTYTVKATRPEAFEVDWATSLEKSQIVSGNFVKSLGGAKESTCSWPNKFADKKIGWALSPLTLTYTKMTKGDSGQTSFGNWKMNAIQNVDGRRVGVITFANMPKTSVLLEAPYVNVITDRIRNKKGESDWAFPVSAWKTTLISDQIDVTNGIPLSVRIEQVRSSGISLKTLITMTPVAK